MNFTRPLKVIQRLKLKKPIFFKKNVLFYTFLLLYLCGGAGGLILSIRFHLNRESFCLAFLFGAILAIVMTKNSKSGGDSDIDAVFADDLKRTKVASRSLVKVFVASYCFLFSFSVLILFYSLQNYFLPLSFFLCVAGMVAVIAIQTLSADSFSGFQANVILAEIVVLSITVCAAILFLFPSPIGNDSGYHVAFIQNVINSGYFGAFGRYENFPGFYLPFVFSNLIAGIADYKLLQLSSLLMQGVFVLFVFFITRDLFSTKTGLLSTLIVSLSSQILLPRFYYYPSNYAVVFLIFVMYLLFLQFRVERTTSTALLFVATVALVFIHPLAGLVLLLILLLLLLASRAATPKGKLVPTIFFAFAVILTLFWWMKPIRGSQLDIFSQFIETVQNALQPTGAIGVEGIGAATLSAHLAWGDVMLYDLGFALLVFFGVAGSLYVLGTNMNGFREFTQVRSNRIALSVTTLLLCPLPFVLAFVAPNTLPDRWFPFVQLLLAVFAGVTFLLFSKRARHKTSLISTLALVTMLFFMVTSPQVNINTHLYATNLGARQASYSSELQAMDFAMQADPVRVQIRTDIKYIGGTSSISLVTGAAGRGFTGDIVPDQEWTYTDAILVVRDYTLKNGFTVPLFGLGGQLLKIVHAGPQFYDALNASKKVYDNGQASVYVNL